MTSNRTPVGGAPADSATAPEPAVAANVLRNTPFLLLLVALVQSAFGDQLFKVGVPWYATQRGEFFDGALIGIVMAIPIACFGLVAGVLVDRYSRFWLLVGADFVRMVVVAAMAVLVATQLAPLSVLLVGTLLLAAPGTVFMPAVQTLIPVIAGGKLERIARMDALLIGGATTMAILGPSLTGLLLNVVEIEVLLALDAVTFGVSMVLILLVRRSLPTVPPRAAADRPKRSVSGVLANAKAGLRFILADKVLRPQFLVYPVLDGAQYSIVFLLPGYLLTLEESGATYFGLAVAAIGVGRVIGLFTVAHTSLLRRRGIVFVGNWIVQGAALLVMTAFDSGWVVPLALLFVGLPAGMATVAVTSFVQSVVPDELRGRVFAAVMSLSGAAMPLAPLVLGLVATAWSPAGAMVCTGALFVLGGVFLATRSAVRGAS